MPDSKKSSRIGSSRESSLPCLISLTALILLVNGCASVGPDYVTPEPSVPTEHEDSHDP